MKFIHLSDLHIGKQLHHYSLIEDQEHILNEVIDCVKELSPDAVLIAGDIYDKSVPSAEAVSLFDEFLTRLADIRPLAAVMIISGNHDSAQRLDYASRILGRQNIYIAGSVPSRKDEHLKKVTLTDEYGEVDFYLLPFLKQVMSAAYLRMTQRCRRHTVRRSGVSLSGKRLIRKGEIYSFRISFMQGQGVHRIPVIQKCFLWGGLTTWM